MSIFEDEFGDDAASEVITQLEENGDESESQENLDWVVERIEQANLFKHLVNNPVFSPGSASPAILESVNNKLKKFALNELKSLLGGAAEDPQKNVKVELPFSEDEVSALKTLAGKVLEKTGGQAKMPEERVPTINPINVTNKVVSTNKIATEVGNKPKTSNMPTTAKAVPQKKEVKKQARQPMNEEDEKKQRLLEKTAERKKQKPPIKPIAQPVNGTWAQSHAIGNQGSTDVLKSIIGLEMALPSNPSSSRGEGVDAAIEFDPDSQQ